MSISYEYKQSCSILGSKSLRLQYNEYMTIKTTVNEASVPEFIDSIADEKKKIDSQRLIALFETVTKQKAKMWGPSIIGFGQYSYTTKSGATYQMAATGFSPRAQNLTIYTVTDDKDIGALYEKLGKFKISKACLYIKNLEDIEVHILEQIVGFGYKKFAGKHLDYKTGALT
jgi:hypothetical protein